MKGSYLLSLSFGLALWGQAGAARAERCVIKAPTATIEKVEIRPPGEDPFSIRLHGVPVQATLSDSAQATLEVQAPLRFTTEHPANRLGVTVGKRVSLLDGRLRLAAGMTAQFVLEGQRDSERSDAPVTLPLLDLQPAQPISIPCTALGIPGAIANSDTSPELLSPTKRIEHATASAPFPLYAQRKVEEPWVISFRGPLKVLARSGPWVKLQARWSDGSILQGWSNSEDLVIQNDIPTGGLGSLGSIGFGHCGSSMHRMRPIPYVLKPNAPIHNRAGGAIWAHTSGTIKVEGFALDRSDGWIQITSVQGLPPAACSNHDKFWVHADHIQWTKAPI